MRIELMWKCILLFLACTVLSCRAGRLFGKASSGINNQRAKDDHSSERMLFPKLTPHPDTDFMLVFESDGVKSCQEMQPVIKRLEEDLSIKVRRINVNSRPDMAMLYELVGGSETNALPFFFNRRTAQAISGPTPYPNLRKLAMGDPNHYFIENLLPETGPKMRSTGVSDLIVRKMLARALKQKSRKWS